MQHVPELERQSRVQEAKASSFMLPGGGAQINVAHSLRPAVGQAKPSMCLVALLSAALAARLGKGAEGLAHADAAGGRLGGGGGQVGLRVLGCMRRLVTQAGGGDRQAEPIADCAVLLRAHPGRKSGRPGTASRNGGSRSRALRCEVYPNHRPPVALARLGNQKEAGRGPDDGRALGSDRQTPWRRSWTVALPASGRDARGACGKWLTDPPEDLTCQIPQTDPAVRRA